MFRFLKNWFVPHPGNSFEPHVLRVWPAFLVVAISIVFFGAAQFVERSLTHSGGFLAAVVSSVLVDLTNFDRAEEGLHGLAVNPVLVEAAQAKAYDMAAKGYFSHNSPDGKTPWYWLQEAGYSFSYAGENLAVFFGDSEDVERAWMESPSHRANILNSNFSEVGIATAEGFYQGQKTVFVVQMFGTPSTLRSVATIQSEVITDNETEQTEGAVGGQNIEVVSSEPNIPVSAVEVLHQDETFIAVKNDAPVAPSQHQVALQTTLFERLVASPQTALGYAYGVFAGIFALAIVLIIFLEMNVQRPKNIFLGLFVLFVVGALFFISHSEIVVANVDFSLILRFSS